MTDLAHQWVERALKRQLSDFQRRAVDLLCRSQGCGPYDLGTTFERADWEYGRGVRFVLHRPSLATFDGAGLTRLVIGAHEECIRVEIDPVSFRYLAICMWPREGREGEVWFRHPTIEQAVELYRKTYSTPRMY